MKQFLAILFLLSLPVLALAQKAPSWQWATGGGDVGESRGMGVATDAAGNIYITGFFSNSFTIGSTALTSKGGRDIFIAKYDAYGQLQWAKSAGGPEHDKGSGVAIAATGDVYIAGDYRNNATFGTLTISSVGEEDIFIAKYNSSGDILWVKTAGGIYPDHISVGNGNGIAVDGDENVYVTGYYGDNPGSPPAHESAYFGSIMLTSAGGSDIFLAKYDLNGNVVWAKSAGGVFSDYGVDIVADDFNNIYATGIFGEPWMYFENIKLNSEGFNDVYIAKYNNNGDVVWAKSAGSDLPDGCADIEVDNNGHIYITGSFSGNTMKIGTKILNTQGGFDAFIAQYDTAGNIQWAKSAGWTSIDGAHGVATDENGNIYIAGDFSGKCIFDNDTLTGFGSYDAYVAKYDNLGKLLWAQKAGGLGYDEPNSIALDKGGNIYISGRYTGTATFGQHTISSLDSSDVFLAKLGPFPAGVNERERDLISIYPNPATGFLQISNLAIGDTYHITDITGRNLQTGKINNKQQQIDIKTLTPGVYYIYLQQANATHKFIKL